MTIKNSLPTIAAAVARVFVLAALLTAPALTLAAPPPTEAEAAAARGVNAYQAGRYAEALPDLEKATQGGDASGMLFYMLGYCYDNAKDADKSSAAYAKAQASLEKEVAGPAPSLESFFYLTNLHQNRGNNELARQTAQAGTAAIESKKVKVGKDGTSLFRAGKLFTDAGNPEKALEYQRKAVAAFAKDPNAPVEYYKRSLDIVARADLGKGDPEDVADMWEKLLALNPRTSDGNWGLGLATLRAKRYAIAKDAFAKARTEGGERSEDAYYASSTAGAAFELTEAGIKVPVKDDDGKPISALDEAVLDERIKKRAENARALLGSDLKPDQYTVVVNKRGVPWIQPSKKLQHDIDEQHRYFLALAIEVVLRGLPVQQKAFQDGYSPLIIQNWKQLWLSAHSKLQEEVSGKGEKPAGAEAP